MNKFVDNGNDFLPQHQQTNVCLSESEAHEVCDIQMHK